MNEYRQQNGNEKEKARKREVYHSNEDIKEKKKQTSRNSYQVLKKKNDLRKKEEKTQFKLRTAKNFLSHNIKFAQERNNMGKN